ncbi:hypothetical protein Tco_0480078, partial [Tanacetum coccineum]
CGHISSNVCSENSSTEQGGVERRNRTLVEAAREGPYKQDLNEP